MVGQIPYSVDHVPSDTKWRVAVYMHKIHLLTVQTVVGMYGVTIIHANETVVTHTSLGVRKDGRYIYECGALNRVS